MCGTNAGLAVGDGAPTKVPISAGAWTVPVPGTWQAAHGQATSEAGARAQAIAQCKSTNTPRDCKSCHGGSSKVSTAPVRISPAVLRAAPARGTSSGGSDQVRRGAPDPCGSELKPCKPKTGITNPGLLEGGGGFGTQGPAAAGSPIQTAPSQLQRGGGSGGGGSGLR
jgi:hypothetical protein